MEIFSQGICVRISGKLSVSNGGFIRPTSETRDEISGSVTKKSFIGFPKTCMKRVFLELRNDRRLGKGGLLDLPVDFIGRRLPRLVTLGEIVNEEEPPFLTKWRELPAAQRLKKSSFADLVRSCRKDISTPIPRIELQHRD